MIARVNSSEFSSGLFEQGKPAIVTDALTLWQVGTQWTPEALARVATNRKIVSSRAQDGRYQFAPSHEGARSNVFENSDMDFGEAARRLMDPADDDNLYVMQQSIPEKLPELLDDVVVPSWIAHERPAINLWFGRRTATQLHFDNSNNFFAQLYGTKEFTLFAPADSDHLYPYHHDSATSHLSYVDLDDPALDQYPNFPRAQADRFTMQPGELLFLPAFWWHHVRAPGVAVSVNFWWAPRWNQILAAHNALRALPTLYATDRLKTFERMFLAPERLNLMTGAECFLASGRTWGACILALAALDEWIRKEKGGLGDGPRPAGCRLSGLSAELRQMADHLSAGDARMDTLGATLHEAARLAASVAQHYGDETVEASCVAAFLRAVKQVCDPHRHEQHVPMPSAERVPS